MPEKHKKNHFLSKRIKKESKEILAKYETKQKNEMKRKNTLKNLNN